MYSPAHMQPAIGQPQMAFGLPLDITPLSASASVARSGKRTMNRIFAAMRGVLIAQRMGGSEENLPRCLVASTGYHAAFGSLPAGQIIGSTGAPALALTPDDNKCART